MQQGQRVKQGQGVRLGGGGQACDIWICKAHWKHLSNCHFQTLTPPAQRVLDSMRRRTASISGGVISSIGRVPTKGKTSFSRRVIMDSAWPVDHFSLNRVCHSRATTSKLPAPPALAFSFFLETAGSIPAIICFLIVSRCSLALDNVAVGTRQEKKNFPF